MVLFIKQLKVVQVYQRPLEPRYTKVVLTFQSVDEIVNDHFSN